MDGCMGVCGVHKFTIINSTINVILLMYSCYSILPIVQVHVHRTDIIHLLCIFCGLKLNK